jgi:hypothetical protein
LHNIGLIRIPPVPQTPMTVTETPVRGSLPALSDRARLFRDCPAAQLVLSVSTDASGVKKWAIRVPVL